MNETVKNEQGGRCAIDLRIQRSASAIDTMLAGRGVAFGNAEPEVSQHIGDANRGFGIPFGMRSK
jgi:hypothetical protein